MTTSEQINEIALALASAQSQMGVALKDSENPYFKSKYADLASVWDACRGPLSKNGLAVVQSPSADGSRVMVETLLTHSSGQWIRGTVSATAKDESPQSVGSAITYLRRYALQSFAAVAPEEDDAEAAQGRQRSEELPTTAPATAGRLSGKVQSSPAAPLTAGTTKVKDVQVKQGASKKGPWTRYAVTFEDGRDGVTFSQTMGEAARAAQIDGYSVNPEIVKGEKGHDLKALYTGGPSRQLEPAVEKGPEEPVDGPEKPLTGRVLTMRDGTKAWVLQTSKRQMYTDEELHAQGFKRARTEGLMVTPTLIGTWTGPDGAVMARLKRLVVEHPEHFEIIGVPAPEGAMKDLVDTVASEEFTREPGDDD